MSRSYRKPYYSWCSGSMRVDKDLYHRHHRAKIKQAFDSCEDLEELHTPIRYRETSDVYCMTRDGKQVYAKAPREHTADWWKELYIKIQRK
jgi:hypothetical protein